MSARQTSHQLHLHWIVFAAVALSLASFAALRSAVAQDIGDGSTAEGQPRAETGANDDEQLEALPERSRENSAKTYDRSQRERRSAARDIARDDDFSGVDRSDNRKHGTRSDSRAARDETQYDRSTRSGRLEPGEDIRDGREDFREDPRRPRYYRRDQQNYSRNDLQDERLERSRGYGSQNDPRERYRRDDYDRQSYDRDDFGRDEPSYRDDRRSDRLQRRGALRERLRERLDEARENPQEFADRIGTIIRGAEQVGSMLGSSRTAPSLGVNLDTSTPGRVRVTRVLPDSPASRAGLQPGDEILLIDGRRVSSRDRLVQYLSEIDPVEEAEIVVRRGGQDLTLWADFSPQADETEELTDEVYEPSSRSSGYGER